VRRPVVRRPVAYGMLNAAFGTKRTSVLVLTMSVPDPQQKWSGDGLADRNFAAKATQRKKFAKAPKLASKPNGTLLQQPANAKSKRGQPIPPRRPL
jgi:hypothetical protein